jgi:hypothetical protein
MICLNFIIVFTIRHSVDGVVVEKWQLMASFWTQDALRNGRQIIEVHKPKSIFHLLVSEKVRHVKNMHFIRTDERDGIKAAYHFRFKNII